MKGNLAVLTILGLFLVGAIWITVWAPTIAPKNVAVSTQSWIGYPVPEAPWVHWDAVLRQEIRDLQAEMWAKIDRKKAERKELVAEKKGASDDAKPGIQKKIDQIDKDISGLKREFGESRYNKKTEKTTWTKNSKIQMRVTEHAKRLGDMTLHGKQLYEEFCASCHGNTGAGDGIAASFLPVPPRNFKIAKFRFKTTPEGMMPLDSDLYRTISLGARGTPMPAFAHVTGLKRPDQRWALIAYIKTLPNPEDPGHKKNPWSNPFFRYKEKPVTTLLGPPPAGANELAAQMYTPKAEKKEGEDKGKNGKAAKPINMGKDLFVKNCAKCHGDTGLGDGASAPTLKDSSGVKEVPMDPRNFHRPWEFKRGHNVADIAWTISTGLNGTPMPSHLNTKDLSQTTLTRREIWAVSAHVWSIAAKRPNFVQPRFRDPGMRLGRPDATFTIREIGWKYELWIPGDPKKNKPDRWEKNVVLEVQQGALVRIKFLPSDNGMGFGQGLAISGYESSVYVTAARVDRPATVTFRAKRSGTFRIYNPTQSAPGHILKDMTGTLKVAPRGTE